MSIPRPFRQAQFDGAARRSQIIGVLGGMGPAATADFYAKLVAASPAEVDQEHPQVVMWSDPSIPDRTRALAGVGQDPSPWLIRGLRF